MPEPGRVTLHTSVEIPVPAADVWALICDWAGMLRWWLTAAEGGSPGPTLVTCDLIGEPEAVPRTRRMTLSNGAVAAETICYQNDETRRISYLKSDEPGITGYVATTYVDERADGGCTVHLTAMFDVTDPGGQAAASARFEAVYTAMFDGYRRYFSRSGR